MLWDDQFFYVAASIEEPHLWATLRERDAVILGVSLDDVKSHKAFAEKYSLPFSLLSDAEGEVAERYGVVRNLGIMKMAKRQTFLIGPDGVIAIARPAVFASILSLHRGCDPNNGISFATVANYESLTQAACWTDEGVFVGCQGVDAWPFIE